LSEAVYRLAHVPVALVFIVVVGLLNFWGISESVRINVAFTLTEVLGLLLIALIGIEALST
jgi:amino acid transporter